MSKYQKTVKRLTKTGAITLTKDIRYLTGLHAHDAVDVEVCEINGNWVINIMQHIPQCFFCGSQDNLKNYKKYPVCQSCRRELAK